MVIYTKALLDNIKQMQKLVKSEIDNGNILIRSDNEIATNIRSYTLALEGNDIVGFAALHIHTSTLAEIRSLVVAESHRGEGIGKSLVLHLLEEAKALKVKDVLSLTYQQRFFERLDFKEIAKESIPEPKIWADCIKCTHFPVCNEVSLIKTI